MAWQRWRSAWGRRRRRQSPRRRRQSPRRVVCSAKTQAEDLGWPGIDGAVCGEVAAAES